MKRSACNIAAICCTTAPVVKSWGNYLGIYIIIIEILSWGLEIIQSQKGASRLTTPSPMGARWVLDRQNYSEPQDTDTVEI